MKISFHSANNCGLLFFNQSRTFRIRYIFCHYVDKKLNSFAEEPLEISRNSSICFLILREIWVFFFIITNIAELVLIYEKTFKNFSHLYS